MLPVYILTASASKTFTDPIILRFDLLYFRSLETSVKDELLETYQKDCEINVLKGLGLSKGEIWLKKRSPNSKTLTKGSISLTST